MCNKEEAKFVILKLILEPSLSFHRITFCKDLEEVLQEKQKLIEVPKIVNKGPYLVLPVVESFIV